MDGFGICGLRQCCNSHLKECAPISTQHAREQDLSLNPSKISGNCGRLLCCLRYEVDHYKCVKKKFPPLGTVIRTEKGTGTVERIDVFSEEAVFTDQQDCRCRVKADEIQERLGKPGRRKPTAAPDQQEPSLEDREELRRLDNGEQSNS